MTQSFNAMLTVGGHANSLGRVNDVVQILLDDSTRLDELYACLFDEDAWVRMRAADALEKICRIHKDWLIPYVDRLQAEFTSSDQASIQWHLAQIYQQVLLTAEQKQIAIKWLENLLATNNVDWIVSANAMDALAMFARAGLVDKTRIIKLLEIQKTHKSKAVIKRAHKYNDEFSKETIN